MRSAGTMRLAYFSPLPPQASGIADYSAELLPYLAREAEIELFVEEGVQVRPDLAERFLLRSHREFPALAQKGTYDFVLYHLGNEARYHAAIYRTLLSYPGVVVLHEVVLHHLIRGMTLGRGDPAAYVEEMRYGYGASGAAIARGSLERGIPVDPWTYPLFERVVDRSLGVIVHNEFCRRRVLASRPLARVAKIPHHLALEALPVNLGDSREALRRSLDLPEDAFLVGSFGFLTPEKRLEVVLRAFARLEEEIPQALLVLAGEVQRGYDLHRLLSRVQGDVRLTGRVPLPTLLQYMAACDVAVNLRYPTGGETSGTLIRLLGLGKPVVVTHAGAFAELPDDCCAKVDPGPMEEEELLALLRALAQNEPLRRQMGENAQRHMATHHTLEGSARGYLDFLRELAGVQADPVAASPPLAPYPPEDLLTRLAASVGAELVDLGMGEREEELLEEVARALVDLDLDLSGKVQG